MAEVDNTNKTKANPEEDYLEIIEQMKNSSVPMDDYNKLAEDHKRLLEKMVSGEKLEDGNNGTPAPVDKEALRKKLYGSDVPLSNLDYVETTLQLRQAIIDEGGKDPFLPQSPTADDVIKAQNTADVFQQCIDYAQGDSEIFTSELQRRTVDAMRGMGR